MRFNSHTWTTGLQERLNREAAAEFVAVEASADDIVAPPDASEGLVFGAYAVSPLRGLHFDSSEDSAAS